MSRDFFPRRESDILELTRNLRARIEPEPSQFGLTREEAEDYALVQQQFADLFRAARSPSDRTSPIIKAKNAARMALEASTRKVAGIIGSNPGTTTSMRAALGLALSGRGGSRSRLPLPKQSPQMAVRSIDGRIAKMVLMDGAGGGQRRPPHGVCGAILWSFVGEMPPTNGAAWNYSGQTARTINRIAFDEELAPGTKVWLTACWVNIRGQRGRLSTPVLTHVGAGGGMTPGSRKAARILLVSGNANGPIIAPTMQRPA